MNGSFVLLISLCLVAVANGALPGRVVGGGNAPEGKHPYQVAISYSGGYWCGGSILNERYILTAAHCIKGLGVAMVRVMYGTVTWGDKNAEWHKVAKLIPHENYSPTVYAYDVGLVELKEKIVFSDTVKPVELPTSDDIEGTFSVVASGWGRLSAGGQSPKRLQEIELDVISHNSCHERWDQALRSHICTFTKFGQGVCNGDSGGPLVAGNTQVGIVSFGMPCARGYPDVFTRVYSFLDWIEEHMEN